MCIQLIVGVVNKHLFPLATKADLSSVKADFQLLEVQCPDDISAQFYWLAKGTAAAQGPSGKWTSPGCNRSPGLAVPNISRWNLPMAAAIGDFSTKNP